jgi:hypothetical protein
VCGQIAQHFGRPNFDALACDDLAASSPATTTDDALIRAITIGALADHEIVLGVSVLSTSCHVISVVISLIGHRGVSGSGSGALFRAAAERIHFIALSENDRAAVVIMLASDLRHRKSFFLAAWQALSYAGLGPAVFIEKGTASYKK